VHFVKALLDSRAMGNFIDRDFVRTKGINTWSISHPILVYNMDSSPNEAGQISKVIDIVLHYKTHSERMLLTVSSLGKQNMILGYTWLKDHNLEVNWQTGEVQMNQCPPQCEGCRVIRKEQVAFEDLKTVVTTAPVLVSPQELDPFRIEADSSDFAIGAVLSQQLMTDGKWHPVTFYSKSLSFVEQNYEIYDKECWLLSVR